MPRSRIFGIYILIIVFALSAGMLIAQFFGSATPLLSGYVAPAQQVAPTATAAVHPTNPVNPTALPESVATVVPPSEVPTATAAVPTIVSEAPTAQPATTTEPGYSAYTVQKGDTLKSIGEKYGVTVRELIAANQIANPDSLIVGSIVRIPTTQ